MQTILVSDLTGQELGQDGQTVRFGFLGVDYDIDLSQEEADEFANTIQKYTDAGRRVGGRRQSGSAKTAPRDPSQTKAIKTWLDGQGIDYPKRGRLAQDLIDQWEAAHKQ
ncbi:Lsr2 family protein [Ornithinimicrobium cryptoxanthini]|uniref:Lsr2 family protein n=1 Tax=Ornithinimicrobium cryptoxanthini TaxID=2934161 RepID=A0ABY4YFJ5_9MICO|nr:Lsr2 family protein [Ornithinimicrobium cryptoxanthini]USQ75330.1 Lsr2 family protein [Ornithinimicrobium cryptoxanthini]